MPTLTHTTSAGAAPASSEAADFEFDYEELPETSPLTMHLIAGAAAGIMEHSVMYPFDIVKTRMQVVGSPSAVVYSGVTHALRTISTTEGVRSLWRGVMSVVLGAGPAHAVYFATYEQTKKMFTAAAGGNASALAAGAAGGVATIVSDALMNPFDVIKQRMQLAGTGYRNIFDCASKVLRSEGLRAFYVSYPTTLVMNMPFQSIQFGCYDLFRRSLNPSGVYSPVTHVLAGGMAGAVAAALTTPIDCCKTLLQTRGTSTNMEVRAASSMASAARIIYSQQGLAGFTRGMKPRVIANFPATAISWTTYEYFKWMIARRDTKGNI
ncbi:Fe(2+) transporter [Coemansia thaxteri]|uniref:Fe(2+) transporter n=1 Tax=Coemansia thaxteri TaxID=2663907 RepID=A0A9W8EJV0_9FUNG|nr:Fe(2+) transporter [Coemansia thaxteri]KAJ2005163.1 Fe(2+) transporter [Coemansia thaxteri]KAJ2468591.1 Fe(2+) transporter [Coemansia sp. RSA 2322]